MAAPPREPGPGATAPAPADAGRQGGLRPADDRRSDEEAQAPELAPREGRPRGADLSHLLAIVPVRSLSGAKTRLGGPLDAEERETLVGRSLGRTIEAARRVPAIAGVIAVSPDPAILKAAEAAGGAAVTQRGEGLNPALRTATEAALASGATAVLVLPPDLPAVSPETLREVLDGATASLDPSRPLVVIVADRHGRGTNLLLVSPPDAIDFAFGTDSRAAHLEEARAAGAAVVEIASPLSLDLDLPEDLVLAEQLGLLDPADAG